MTKTVALVGALIAAAQPVLGLSCLPVDPVETLANPNTPQTVLVGRLGFTEEVWPGPGEWVEPFEIGFDGYILTPEGFVPASVDRITMQFACQEWGCGPWTSDPVGIFVTGSEATRFEFVVDACFSTVFGPSPDVMTRLESCATGGECQWPTYN